MNTPITAQTRREFLRTAAVGGVLSWTIPAFLANTLAAMEAEAAGQSTQSATGRDSTILLILQMAGGNDGLNTVVPYANGDYRRARPRLALPENQLLKLNDELALHPGLAGFKMLYDEGRLAIVQGVGYPNPNRSHFRSTEIWQTASDSNRFENRGWVGRYFDNACAGCDPVVGVSVGRQMPQAFSGRDGKGVSVANPQNYRFLPPGNGRVEEAKEAEASFRKLNEVEEESAAGSGGTIASLQGNVTHAGSALDFLERVAFQAQTSSDQIRATASRGQTQATYPASQLGNSLKLVSKLIAGGLPTRVYYVSQGGYDTHTNQLTVHERLLKDLGDSLKSFIEGMKEQGNLSRVLVMTFSEFGRRVADNASGGTDHGAAAPMFIIGDRVKAGLIGTCPSLSPADLFQGDLKYHIDFRSVYASVLEQWLKISSQPVLGRKFPELPLV